MIFKKYDIPEGTLKNWIVKYKSGGFDNLTKKQNKKKYTSEFKLSVMHIYKSIILPTDRLQNTLILAMDQQYANG